MRQPFLSNFVGICEDFGEPAVLQRAGVLACFSQREWVEQEARMSEHEAQDKLTSAGTVKVAVDREAAPRFGVGTRWEVVTSSLESLWHGPYTMTLRPVDDGADGKGSR